MLISYPILPQGVDSESERERLTAMLGMVQADRGVYPVSSGNRWHGGIHMRPGDEPIRAIADGTVVAYRKAPDTREYPGQGEYDTSFVLLRHETESGEGTPVVFYSLYMHLQPFSRMSADRQAQVVPFLRDAGLNEQAVRAPENTRIWRKEVLGFAGQLYGQSTLHFEIFATEADFNAFWKDRNTINAGQHGSDDVFGHSYFIIPAGCQFQAQHPRATPQHHIAFPGNHSYDLLAQPAGHAAQPAPQAGQNADRLLVMVKLNRGNRTTTTYRLDAQGHPAERLGEHTQEHYEYELYRLATALYPDCPSAGFEYLRFGRILGPDTTNRNENWQLVHYAQGARGYIDLATNQVSVLSDADFPMLWERLDEGDAANAQDGIANIPRLSTLLNLPASPTNRTLFAEPEFIQRTTEENVQAHLRHFICKHPSEWDAGDLDSRYSSLRGTGRPLHDDTAWRDFREHVEHMAFWPSTGLERSVWHFHPLQFISHYRKCGWLSLDEVTQLIPRRHGIGSTANIPWETARSRISAHHVELNKTLRKYNISDWLRQSHFLAQTYIETAVWQTMREFGRGRQQRRRDGTLFWPAPAMQYYTAFYGRGIMQLTWAGNYDLYLRYRTNTSLPDSGNYTDNRITTTSLHYWQDPRDRNGRVVRQPQAWHPRYNPEIIADNSHEACDTGGFYWASKHIGGNSFNINQVCDRGDNPAAIGRVCVLVNGGHFGYLERHQYFAYIKRYRSDEISTNQAGSTPSVRRGTTTNVNVFYSPQRP